MALIMEKLQEWLKGGVGYVLLVVGLMLILLANGVHNELGLHLPPRPTPSEYVADDYAGAVLMIVGASLKAWMSVTIVRGSQKQIEAESKKV